MGVKVVHGGGVQLAVGQVWELVIAVTDRTVAPTVAVTLPAGGDPVEVVAVACGWVGYVARYVTTVPGMHVALVDGGLLGTTAVAANVIAVADGTTMPDVTALDDYLGEHSATDEELADALATEIQAQWDVCRVPAAYPYSLREAVLRRCARNLALRGLPLAVLRGDGEAGDTVLPGADPEVRRLEKPYRRMKVG